MEEGKIKDFFGASGEKSEGGEPVDEAAVGSDSPSSSSSSESSTESVTSTTASASASPSATPAAKKSKDKTKDEDLSTIKLEVETKPLGIPAMTLAEIRKSREKYVPNKSKNKTLFFSFKK